MTIYEKAAAELLRFAPQITVVTKEPYQTALTKILQADPRCIYYVKSMRCSNGFGQLVFEFEYRNTEYAPGDIFVDRGVGQEAILRYNVAKFRRTLVLVEPSHMDFLKVMERFMKKSSVFYPQLVSYSCQASSFPNIPVTAYEVTFQYRIGTVMLRQMNGETSREVQRLKSLLFTPDMPMAVKCLIAHNYLASTITYHDNKKASPLERSHIQSAYGALVKRQCVCQGYAEAFKLLMDTQNIPCDVVLGQILDGSEEWHAWNIVRLNGGKLCFHIDVTWDSGKTALPKTTYFLKSDDFFRGKREWERSLHASCVDGKAVLTEVKRYIIANRGRLLAAGLRPEWLIT